MAYWQVRDGFNHRDIENIDKIQVDDLLFLVTEGIFVMYARCAEVLSKGVIFDEWENFSLDPALLVSSLERGSYSQKISLIKNNEKIYELLTLIQPLEVYKIKHLKVINFRLIEELEINFNEDVNVIIGNNGAGKTTILDTIALGFGLLSTYFPSIKGIGFSDKDLRVNSSNKKEPFSRIKISSNKNLHWDRIEKRDTTKKNS